MIIKKSLNKFLFFLMIFLGNSVLLSTSFSLFAESPVPCNTIDHSSSVTIGTKCLTSKGHLYERVENVGFGPAWKSAEGMIWSDVITKTHTPDINYKICEKIGGKLPSIADFIFGELHDLSELLPIENAYFWTSSEMSKDNLQYVGDSSFVYTNFAFYSSKKNRNYTPIYLSNGYIPAHVRCVLNHRESAPIQCASLDSQKPISIGTKCETSTGWIYERVDMPNFGNAWKDPNGIIWSSPIGELANIRKSIWDEDGELVKGEIVDSEAALACKKIGGVLPSSEDFEKTENNDFRELFRFFSGAGFWTSTSKTYNKAMGIVVTELNRGQRLTTYEVPIFDDYYNKPVLWSVICTNKHIK